MNKGGNQQFSNTMQQQQGPKMDPRLSNAWGMQQGLLGKIMGSQSELNPQGAQQMQSGMARLNPFLQMKNKNKGY